MSERKKAKGNDKTIWKAFLVGVGVLLGLWGNGWQSGYAAEEEEVFVPSSVPPPEFSAEGGFYEEGFELTLRVPEGTTVYYSLDGTEPYPGNFGTKMYTEPIRMEARQRRKGTQLLSATVVRAVAIAANEERSDVQTHTYFVGPGVKDWYRVPVISLVMEPDDFYGEDIGIYANPDEKGREWERPAHFEYFLPEGTRAFALNVGVRIHGGYSRRFPLKSLRVYARAEYDMQKNFQYDFFSDSRIPAVEKNGEKKKIEQFKRLLLRAAGNEADAWETTFFRDILAQSLMTDTLLDLQSYQPAVAFLNGQFYGILNIQERMDDRYLASHYNCKETEVAIYGFEYNKNTDGTVILPPAGEPVFEVTVEEGPAKEKEFFETAYDFVVTQDMSDPAMYAKAQEYFDIENFVDYLCLQFYSGNTDWPHNNCEAWRYIGEPSEEYGLDGRIRWLVFDLDFAFGLYGHRADENTIVSMVADQSGEQPYRDVLTCLFRAFLQNDEFKEQFKARFLELLKTNFAPKNVTAKMDALEKIYAPLVLEHYMKYGEKHSYRSNVSEVRDYVAARSDILKGYLEWVLDPEKHAMGLGLTALKQGKLILVALSVVLIGGVLILLGRRKKRAKKQDKG